MTEATMIIAMSQPEDPSTLHTGGPIRSAEIKLVEIPSMNYYISDTEDGVSMPRGEVWIRGASVVSGYYKMPERTADAITPDGWIKSGDVAQLLPNGALRIIDRIKSHFKISQGEYIAPEKIEIKINEMPSVTQSFIDGHLTESYVVGVIVPDPDFLRLWAKKSGHTGKHEELCQLP
jgi:long-chain acyl-CoA synthetase